MADIVAMNTADCRALFEQTLIEAASVEELSLADLKQVLSDVGFATVRGIAKPDEIARSRAAFRDGFTSDDHPGVGESAKDIQANFQKLRAGISPLAPTNSRLVRTIFNPLWADDIFGLRDVFMRMIAMRNMLVGKPPTYASTTIEDGLWTAARLQHYPTGGGFMSAHVDQMVVDAVSNAGLEHVQLLLMLTKKGEDYERGGGFTVKDGKFIDVEQFCELGDIVVYDSRILHGVDTVDPHKRLDLDTPDGRTVAFVTLYKDMA